MKKVQEIINRLIWEIKRNLPTKGIIKNFRFFIDKKVLKTVHILLISFKSSLNYLERKSSKYNLETLSLFIGEKFIETKIFIVKTLNFITVFARHNFTTEKFNTFRIKIDKKIKSTYHYLLRRSKSILNFLRDSFKKSPEKILNIEPTIVNDAKNREYRTISILVPCYNEEKSIAACIESCLNQTRKADQILVVNDGSTDRSAEILASFGDKIEVINIPIATGNKSLAQEIGLQHVRGEIFFATDGDTILDSHIIEEIEKSFDEDSAVVAVGGYVKGIKYNWLTACRELDYIIGQNLHKVAQDYIDAVFVIPGCAGAFKTDVFRKYIKFDHDTLTEDLDFTYKLHENYFKIAYNRNAIAYTQDPATVPQYINQMRRWYSGGWQNLKKHYTVISKPNNSLQLALTYFEGLVFSFAIFAFPLINIKFFSFFIIPYFAFLILLGIYGSILRKRVDLLLYSPFYIVLVFINSYIFLEQFYKEILLGKTNLVWFHPDRREIKS